MPEDSGSTSPSTIWVAMAASTAEPPARSISSPASRGMGIGRRHHVVMGDGFGDLRLCGRLERPARTANGKQQSDALHEDLRESVMAS